MYSLKDRELVARLRHDTRVVPKRLGRVVPKFKGGQVRPTFHATEGRVRQAGHAEVEDAFRLFRLFDGLESDAQRRYRAACQLLVDVLRPASLFEEFMRNGQRLVKLFARERRAPSQ